MTANDSPLIMEIVTDPVELARLRPQWERFDRNWNWFKEHAAEVYEAHRGKCICIAGAQVFAADTSEEATALAERAHPDDDGRFMLCVPLEKAVRIYACSRGMVTRG